MKMLPMLMMAMLSLAVSAQESAPIYRFEIETETCERRGEAFWEQSNPCMAVTLSYETGTITGYFCKDETVYFNTDEVEMWTSPEWTFYGPGCTGGGFPRGTDAFSGLYVRNLTEEPLRVDWIEVSLLCNDDRCYSDFRLNEVTVGIDNGECGYGRQSVLPYRSYCGDSFSFNPVIYGSEDLWLDVE